MLSLRHVPIQHKQTLIIMLTACVALLLACAGFVSYDVLAFRKELRQNLTTLAEVIGNTSTAALEYNDPKVAEETLSALRAEPNITIACISTPSGQVFAKYSREKLKENFKPPPNPPGHYAFQDHYLLVWEPILSKGELIGTLFLQTDLSALSERLSRYAGIVGVVLAASLLVALFLSNRLQRLISGPILHLAQAARAVGQEQDFSFRATKHGNDELGILIDGFNEMLTLLQMRDAELKEARDSLERRVEERTRELEESLSVLHATLESTADGILVVDGAGKVINFNEKFRAMWDLPPVLLAKGDDNTLLAHVLDRLKDSQRFLDKVHQLYAAPDAESHDLVEFKDGRVFERDSQPQRIGGKSVGRVWSFRDITDRKRAEEALRESNERFQLVARATNDAVWDWDVTTNTVWWNQGLQTLFGYQPEQMDLGIEAWTSRLHPEDRERVLADFQTVIHFGQYFWTGEYRFRRASGEYAYIFDRACLIRDAEHRPLRVVDAMVDITERKRAEEELKRAKETAEAASQAKSQFLANVSHEIRTPMNAILGMTRLALDTKLTAEQRSLLTTVKDSAEILLTIINDILDFSKIEAGKMELEPISFNLRTSLEDTVAALGLRAHEKGLELACFIEGNVPEMIVGDPYRLRQVVTNLLANAIKFTESGEVVLRVGAESKSADSVRLHFAVTDTGIGIPESKQRLIFEAFTQADNSTTRNYGGTGLGLTISSQLIGLMGGSIWVESKVGLGSTFHFNALFELGQAAQPDALPVPAGLNPLRVLIVDDNATTRRILELLLTRWGMQPTAVDNGPAALEELRRGLAWIPYSVVLLDATMPEMDGFAVAEKIKAIPDLPGALVMMLSSGTQLSETERCRELGINLHVIKPIKQSDLMHAIMTALGSSRWSDLRLAVTPPGSELKSPRPRRILLAEDHPVNQRLARSILERWGHSVVVAGNGRKAVEALEQDTYDLVLMDLQMPEMGGLEATQAIREKEKGTAAHIPIIAMTAHAIKGDREQCLAAGMDDYVTKPIDPDALFKAIETATGADTPEPAVPEPAVPEPAVPEPAAPEPVPPAPTVHLPPSFSIAELDRQAIFKRVGGDRQLLAELVRLFFEDAATLLGQMRCAIEARDGAALQQAAHRFKGAAANFEARAAVERAFRLQQIGRHGDWADAEIHFMELEIETARLQPALAALLHEKAA